MIIQSESVGKLYPDLVKALSEVRTVKKDAKSFKNTYATLEAVIDVVRPIFANHNLGIVQFPVGGDHELVYGVETRIIHTSGEWIGSASFMRVVKDDPQAIGSLTSYLKRYQMMGAVCMASGDDDGVDASNAKPEPVMTQKVAVDKDAHKAALTAIGEAFNMVLVKEYRDKIREIVFRGKSKTDINSMTIEALRYAATEVKRYAEMPEGEFNKYYEEIANA